VATSRCEDRGVRKIRTRSGLIALISAVLLVAVLVTAAVDRSSNKDQIRDARAARLTCKERNVRCDEETPKSIRDDWNRRKLAYGVSGFFLVILGGAAVLIPVVRRRA
jgi:uncharacterized protein YlxW (UPF0749 family)